MSISTRCYTFAIAAALFTTPMAFSQSAPQGWKVITDSKKLCQVMVPADWVADKIMTSMATAPDKKTNVVVHGLPAGTDFAQTIASAKQIFPPVKVYEETAGKVLFSSKHNGTPGVDWYFATAGSQVCNAQLSLAEAIPEAVAKQIVASLGPKK